MKKIITLTIMALSISLASAANVKNTADKYKACFFVNGPDQGTYELVVGDTDVAELSKSEGKSVSFSPDAIASIRFTNGVSTFESEVPVDKILASNKHIFSVEYSAAAVHITPSVKASMQGC